MIPISEEQIKLFLDSADLLVKQTMSDMRAVYAEHQVQYGTDPEDVHVASRIMMDMQEAKLAVPAPDVVATLADYSIICKLMIQMSRIQREVPQAIVEYASTTVALSIALRDENPDQALVRRLKARQAGQFDDILTALGMTDGH